MEKGILYTPSESFWTIPDVVYQGEIGTYRIFENLIPAMNQNKLAEFYEREKQKGNPYPTDAPLIWAIADKSYDLRDKNSENSERLRNFLQLGLRESPITLSRVIWNPEGKKDEVMHNYGTLDKYSLEGDFVGCEGKIISRDAKTTKLILGNENVDKINSVAKWINSTGFFIWRLAQKPKKKIEGVVNFGAGPVELGFVCSRDTGVGCPAFRVLRVE